MNFSERMRAARVQKEEAETKAKQEVVDVLNKITPWSVAKTGALMVAIVMIAFLLIGLCIGVPGYLLYKLFFVVLP